jgi:acyl-CoA thioesterase
MDKNAALCCPRLHLYLPTMIDPKILAYIQKDTYSDFIGATLEAVEPGYCRVSVVVSESMLNFHGTTHGGIVFGLADIAFAAACNSHGQVAVALSMDIHYLNPSKAGDHLVAEAKEVSRSAATALYDITVSEKNSNQIIAKLKAMAYRTREMS